MIKTKSTKFLIFHEQKQTQILDFHMCMYQICIHSKGTIKTWSGITIFLFIGTQNVEMIEPQTICRNCVERMYALLPVFAASCMERQ